MHYFDAISQESVHVQPFRSSYYPFLIYDHTFVFSNQAAHISKRLLSSHLSITSNRFVITLSGQADNLAAVNSTWENTPRIRVIAFTRLITKRTHLNGPALRPAGTLII